MFEEEAKHHGKRAWKGYIREFSLNTNFEFRQKLGHQRLVHCKICGTLIPKTVPRLFLSGAWTYHSGHYCLRCAESELMCDIEDKTSAFNTISKNLGDLKELLDLVKNCRHKKEYKDTMSVAEMMAKLNPKREVY